MGLGSSQEPLTCLWQLWRDQRGVVRVGGGPSQPGCPGPGSGGGGNGGAAGAVPESEPGEVGSGPPAGLGVGTGAAAVTVGGGPGRGASAPGGCSVGVAACMIFWRTSRIFSCRQTLEGKMSA